MREAARHKRPDLEAPGLPVLSPKAELPQLLTVPEVAAYLQVSPKTVRRLVAKRAIPCVRIGAMVRFQPADLLRFVAARKG